MKSIITGVILLVITAKIESQNSENGAEKKVVCYYTNWSTYRQGRAKFSAQNIDPYLCTDIIYAFATFSDDKLVASDPYEDLENNGYKKFNDLKQINNKLKTTLSIGGTAEGPVAFSNIAASKDKIDTFTKSAIDLLRLYNFDGLNIDWHYPGNKPEDKENYVTFVKTLKEEFEKEAKLSGKPRLLITMSLPSKSQVIEKGYDLLNLQKYVDYFNILCYDYHELHKNKVSHHSPLFSQRQAINTDNGKINSDASVQFLLDKGVMKEKINLGIPTYGRIFKLKNTDNHGFGAPIKDDGNQEIGFKAYYDICKIIKDEKWTVVQVNQTASGPYAYKGEDWIAYDDENIARRKGSYVRSRGLGGVMFWTVDDDDFNGDCGKGKFPIIKATKEGLV
ncbi:hypothetical protein O3M35_010427 [Rhynocoris fuscipes]|uniref:GH18 domain-containing protein n=1 Tax=Rhynocoris fuscipes TaxID=488301 RepID=A0AAW1D1N0_9HEMI